jgi:tripartite-type tricarboxylate transporter receptor subunit TctC
MFFKSQGGKLRWPESRKPRRNTFFGGPMITRRAALAGLSAFAVTPALSKGAWPERSITLVHGFPPGGPVDVLARILAEPLSKSLGQRLAVESKPGATGMTAAGLVAHATPDGYTLLALPGTFTAASAMFKTLPFNPTHDFTFISSTAESPLVLVTHPESEFHTLADVVRIASARETPLQYGTAGVGSIQHLTMERFAKRANIKLQHIPYKGGLPAITDLLGKRIDLVLDPPTALIQFTKDGRLRALAVTSALRFFGLPDVPTMSENGYPGFAVTACQGVVAPAGLPADITAVVNSAVAATLADPDVVEKLKKIGSSPRPSTPQDYKARVIADIAQWKIVIDEAHVARI